MHALWPIPSAPLPFSLQIGNLQATCQLMAKASGSVSGTLADIFSPARMLLAGTAMSAVAKPLFALGAAAHAVLGGGGWLASIIGAQVGRGGVREHVCHRSPAGPTLRNGSGMGLGCSCCTGACHSPRFTGHLQRHARPPAPPRAGV